MMEKDRPDPTIYQQLQPGKSGKRISPSIQKTSNHQKQLSNQSQIEAQNQVLIFSDRDTTQTQ